MTTQNVHPVEIAAGLLGNLSSGIHIMDRIRMLEAMPQTEEVQRELATAKAEREVALREYLRFSIMRDEAMGY